MLTFTGVDSSAAQPSKKSKKSVKVAPEPVVVAEEIVAAVEPAVVEEASAKPSKKTRKRAADFLYDAPEDDSPKPKKGKKDAKVQKEESNSLTADGANGVVEHSDDAEITITTTKQPKKKSMMAEAERTQDAELAEEYASGNDSADEDIDTAPALLTGFDSDNDDPAEDKNFDTSRVAPIPQFKKTSKKLRQAKEAGSDGPGVVYIGRIPHGFYETQMREYFAQFGNITRLRLSRNKTTGASKHFAFVEFESDEVAKIVADTMDNYLMFGHILKCKYAPAETLHADVWKGANKKYRKIPQHKLLKQKAEQPKSEKQIERKMKKVQGQRERKLKQLKDMGYNYELPTLVKPDANAGAIEESKEEQPAIEDKVEGALVPPPNVPKDELAVKVEENQKKAKRGKKESAKEAVPETTEEAPVVAPETSKKPSKKGKKEAAAAEAPVVVAEEIVVPIEEPKVKAKRGKKETAAVEVTPVVAPVAIEEVAVEAAKPAKKGKKGKQEESVTVVETVPVVAEEVAVATEEPAPKKTRKGKKEAVVDATPAVVEEVTTAVEEAPKKSKKSKKEPEAVGEPKVDKKQLKGILKKTKKA